MKKIVSVLVVISIGVIAALFSEFLIKHIVVLYNDVKILDVITRLIITFAVIVVWISVLFRSENPSRKLIWLIVLVINPIFGLTTFLGFGREFNKSLRYKKRTRMHGFNYLVNEPKTDLNSNDYNNMDGNILEVFKTSYGMSHHHVYIGDTYTEVLTNGNEKFPRLINELKNAKNFILMEYYIVRTDKIGKKVLDILKEKSDSGVEVKLVYDAVGGTHIDKKYMQELRDFGVEVKITDKIIFPFFTTKINYRNHRKITIIDGKTGFIGGLNLGDEYNHSSKKFGFWRDTHLLMKGKAVNSLMSIFAKDWYYACGDFLDDEKYYSADTVKSEGYTQVIQSGPDSKLPIIRNTYLKMFAQARESIKIMTPYLILDPETLSALKIAARSGIDVKIIVPGFVDKKTVYKITQSSFQPLLDSGVSIYTYEGVFTHAKVVIIDDKLASCGTCNIDIRSFVINFEATVLLYNDAVKKLVSDYDEDTRNSKQIILEEWKKRSKVSKLLESVLNLISPIV